MIAAANKREDLAMGERCTVKRPLWLPCVIILSRMAPSG